MLKKIVFYITSCIITGFIGCTEKKQNLDSWLGDYHYNEPSIKAIAGYNMVMGWDLSVNKLNDRYSSILNVNGQQTGFSLLCDLYGNDSSLFVIYKERLSGESGKFYKGDTLFSFSRKNKNLVTTRWAALEPRLAEHPPAECICFRFTGTNQNNNSLSIP